MRTFDIILMAVRSLFKRKMRTFLTVLGVVIGTAAIVTMVSLGIAMNISFDEQVKQMGDITKIEIYNPDYWNDAAAEGSDTKLTRESVRALKEIEGVKCATPAVSGWFTIQLGGKLYSEIGIEAIEPDTMEDMGYKISQGRALNGEDAGTFNMVFGSEQRYGFYKKGQQEKFYRSGGRNEEPADVMNEKIKLSFDHGYGSKNEDKNIKPYNINVVGIYGEELKNGYNCVIPIDALEKIKADRRKYNAREMGENKAKAEAKKELQRGYDSAYIKCVSIDYVERVTEELKARGFEAYSPMDSVSGMKKIAGSLQALLGAIGFVSLLVAAIGITNTMIMSIYERTGEIGVMKVIGARLKDIKAMFLLEAVLIGIMGGIIGVAVSYGISLVINNVGLSFLSEMQVVEGAKVSVIPVWLGFCAVAFSGLIGLVSGYLPARRAMKLSALNALKKE